MTFAGIICLAIPLSIYLLWISVYEMGLSQPEQVVIFKSYFPNFLHGRWNITYLGIVFSILAIIFSLKCLKTKNRVWKIINSIVLSISSLLLFLNLFSMM